MRRAAAIVLVLVGALAAALRQACDTTCVDGPEAASAVIAVVDEGSSAASSCHTPEPAPEPAPTPAHCAHDHNGSLLHATRVAAVEPAGQPALSEAPAVSLAFVTHIAIASSSSDLSPGSPPLRLLALRI